MRPNEVGRSEVEEAPDPVCTQRAGTAHLPLPASLNEFNVMT